MQKLISITAIIKGNRNYEERTDEITIDSIKLGDKEELLSYNIEKVLLNTFPEINPFCTREPFIDEAFVTICNTSASKLSEPDNITIDDIKNRLPLTELKFNLKEAHGFKIQSISLIEFTYIELSTKDATIIGIDADVLKEFCENNGYEFDPSVKFDQVTEVSLAAEDEDVFFDEE